jgi:hypothetical protein
LPSFPNVHFCLASQPKLFLSATNSKQGILHLYSFHDIPLFLEGRHAMVGEKTSRFHPAGGSATSSCLCASTRIARRRYADRDAETSGGGAHAHPAAGGSPSDLGVGTSCEPFSLHLTTHRAQSYGGDARAHAPRAMPRRLRTANPPASRGSAPPCCRVYCGRQGRRGAHGTVPTPPPCRASRCRRGQNRMDTHARALVLDGCAVVGW